MKCTAFTASIHSELKDVPATVAKAASTYYPKALLPWREHSVGLLDDQLSVYTLKRSLA